MNEMCLFLTYDFSQFLIFDDREWKKVFSYYLFELCLKEVTVE